METINKQKLINAIREYQADFKGTFHQKLANAYCEDFIDIINEASEEDTQDALGKLGYIKGTNDHNDITYTYYFESSVIGKDKKVIYFQEGFGIGELYAYTVHFDDRFTWNTKIVKAALEVLETLNESTDRSPKAMAFSKALKNSFKNYKNKKEN